MDDRRRKTGTERAERLREDQEVQMHTDGDQYRIMEPVCKRCWRVDDVEALPQIFDRAFRLAESGRPGPVLIDIPMDMFSREMDEDLWDRTYKDSHVNFILIVEYPPIDK